MFGWKFICKLSAPPSVSVSVSFHSFHPQHRFTVFAGKWCSTKFKLVYWMVEKSFWFWSRYLIWLWSCLFGENFYLNYLFRFPCIVLQQNIWWAWIFVLDFWSINAQTRLKAHDAYPCQDFLSCKSRWQPTNNDPSPCRANQIHGCHGCGWCVWAISSESDKAFRLRKKKAASVDCDLINSLLLVAINKCCHRNASTTSTTVGVDIRCRMGRSEESEHASFSRNEMKFVHPTYLRWN